MNRKGWLFIALGLLTILSLFLLTGCSGPAIAQSAASGVLVSQQPQGIWVGGTGEISVIPDMALLNLGIVAEESTVADAQARASDAMAKVMQALTASGIAVKDIQTGYFGINQNTRWDDPKQSVTVIGYQVSNMVTVKIRDIGKAGAIIDSVVKAGGNHTRVNGLSFSVEDPTSYYQQAREKAMSNAKRKAEQLATLSGLTLGKPSYVVENVQSSVVYGSYNRNIGMAIPAPSLASDAMPPISAGETKITLTVEVAYSLNP